MSEELVTLSEAEDLEYILVSPGHFPARFSPRIASYRDLPRILSELSQSEIVAVDFETKGADYSADLQIVGLGLAWDTGCAYFQWSDLSQTNRDKIRDTLMGHPGLIAHNIYFDGGVALKEWGQHLPWRTCTYALLAMCHNESPASRWGLKDAMVNLLGWADSNEHDLDEWLVVNGYYKGNRRINNDPQYLRDEFRAGKLKPEKGEMWRVPTSILGKYCCMDAEATYLLFTEVLWPVCQKFPGLYQFHTDEFLTLIRILIEQKMHGILMDHESLRIRRSQIENSIRDFSMLFRKHKDVCNHILNMESIMRKEILLKEPERLKKNGDISKNWINWKQRLDDAEAGKLPDYNFNLQSGPQLRELFYKRLGNEARILTEKGEAGVGIKALKHMGEAAKILIDRMWATKELSFIDKYLELTVDRPTIHPSFRSPGTVTGRLSSKEPNMQQIPKTKSMMNLFIAPPGKVWVDLDFSALEPVVATEFSQDKNMLAIYGNGRPQNDIYLFVGAHIPGEIGRKIKATGYDPLNPTKEALARAKKECKHERGICKTVTLACQYGAGVRKVNQTLENDDIFLDWHQVEAIHGTYWDVFRGVKEFSKELYYQWRDNGGYILNGIGRPMAVPEDYTQDLLNRFVQSTGHDILVKYVCILTGLLSSLEIPWQPVIIDFHDATTVEVPEEYVGRTVEAFDVAMARLNEVLGGTIKLRGTAVVGHTLADVKEPEE